jgi:hypothetical protein
MTAPPVVVLPPANLSEKRVGVVLDPRSGKDFAALQPLRRRATVEEAERDREIS